MDQVFQGRLVSKVPESSTLNPRWIVSLDDEESSLDQEAYEASFGEILDKPITAIPSTTNHKKPSRKREAVTPDADAGAASNSSGNEGSNPSKPSKASRKTPTTTTTTTRVSFVEPAAGHNTTAARRAREERSRRRQATLQPSVAVHHRKATRVLDHTSRRRSCHSKKKHGPPSASTTVQDKDVVRVPMLTGTLILYRGPHRRAEFVRSV